MARGVVDFAGPLLMWIGPLESWLPQVGCSPGRARRTVNALVRLSTWMAARGLTVADLNEDVIDEHIRAERERSGAPSPAAVQYLPLAKRFLASRGVLVLRGPASRDLGGVPRLPAGPLAGVVTELAIWLRAKGYAKGTALSVAGTAARLGAWMNSHKLDIDDLDGVVLERFVAAQSRGPHRHPSSARRIVTVRKFLIATGRLTPTGAPVPVLDAVGQCLQEWRRCMQQERGAGPGWISEQARWAYGFLDEFCGSDGQICWGRVDVRAVNAYVAAAGRGYSLSSRRHLVAAMRSLLAWAFRTGKVPTLMGAAVLAPGRPRAGLPDVPTAGHVEAILAAADRSVPLGRRDYAIAVMISRLGLRAGEVAGLLLDDIDWHHGRITFCGKGGRILTLPLPDDVGTALVEHLRDPRPAGGARFVFLRSRPPLIGLTRQGVSGAIAALARRAGLGTVAAHRLRHWAATAVLAGGGSLIEARELLGHARTDTTMAYARVDLDALRTLTVPWGRIPA
jgi:site-specific recombinase XerD